MDILRPFYAAARALFPILPQWYVLEDTCVTPEYRGSIGTMPVFCVPPNYALTADEGAHESGHLYFVLLGPGDHLTKYWTFRGFPGTWHDALAESQATTGNASWMLDPRESWAEAFARSVVPTHAEKTMTYGKDMDPLKLRAFFQGLAKVVTPTLESAPTFPRLGRTMYDSITAADIPANAAMVMGYVDGSHTWSAADWARFPNAVKVRICIFNDRMDADVIDIEAGNNDADGAVPWVKAKWAAGQTPTVYCYTDAGPAGYRISDVRQACDAAGVKRPLFIVAKYDNDPSTFDPTGDPEIVGKQYANPTFSGGHYDLTIVADGWPRLEGGEMALDPTSDAATFRAMFLKVYADIGVAALFDQLKAEDAKQAHHRHGVNVSTVSEDTGEPK